MTRLNVARPKAVRQSRSGVFGCVPRTDNANSTSLCNVAPIARRNQPRTCRENATGGTTKIGPKYGIPVSASSLSVLPVITIVDQPRERRCGKHIEKFNKRRRS